MGFIIHIVPVPHEDDIHAATIGRVVQGEGNWGLAIHAAFWGGKESHQRISIYDNLINRLEHFAVELRRSPAK